jgi:hypothetical protein
MPGLVPGIHVFKTSQQQDVDGRDLREDALRAFASAMTGNAEAINEPVRKIIDL